MSKERIDVLLVERGLCESRAKAQARVLAGEVVVDDQRVDKPGTKVDVDAAIRLKGEALPFVSRGGLKLDAALRDFGIDVRDRVCVDVGASTGGFTDVLLKRGARLVHAIDVGTAQLHEKLRQDPRVRSREKTHVLHLPPGALDPLPSVGVVDVSFISLVRVLPALLRQLDEHHAGGCDIVALIKPQFEVGKGEVGKGGVVRDETKRAQAKASVLRAAEALGLRDARTIESPIHGADGNVEYLAHWHVDEGAIPGPS